MSFSSRDGALVLISLLAGGALGAVVASQFSGSRAAPAAVDEGTTGRTAANDATSADADWTRLEDEIARLKAENETLRARTTRESVEPREATGADPAVAEAAVFEPLDGGGLGHALDAVDFALIGKNSVAMTPLIAKLAAALEAGEELPLDILGQIQGLNGALVAEAGKMLEAGVPGNGPNGAYTHPAVAGNRILATLEAAGVGLDDAQRTRLRQLMDEYGHADRSLRASEDSREIALESLVEEVDSKSRFFDEVRGLLGADQVDALGQDGIRDRLQLGVHGPGLVLAQYARPVPVADRATLVSTWSDRLGSELGIDAAAASDLRATVDAWAKTLPSDYFDTPADTLEQKGMMRVARVQQAAARQLELMRTVLAQHGSHLTPEQRRSFARQLAIMVPVPQ